MNRPYIVRSRPKLAYETYDWIFLLCAGAMSVGLAYVLWLLFF